VLAPKSSAAPSAAAIPGSGRGIRARTRENDVDPGLDQVAGRSRKGGQLTEISALEERGVMVEGFVARLRQMQDGDYHIQLAEAWPGHCLGGDTPDQFFTELTPGIRARKPAYTWERLLPLCGADTRIRVSGWLMWDNPHHTRITFWEIHPVTRIELCCWRDLASQ
jgi:hypothetical protein